MHPTRPQDAKNHQWSVDRFPCLPSIKVYGVEVDITLQQSTPCFGIRISAPVVCMLRRFPQKVASLNGSIA